MDMDGKCIKIKVGVNKYVITGLDTLDNKELNAIIKGA